MDAEKRDAIKQVRALMQELGVNSTDILFSESEEIFPGVFDTELPEFVDLENSGVDK